MNKILRKGIILPISIFFAISLLPNLSKSEILVSQSYSNTSNIFLSPDAKKTFIAPSLPAVKSDRNNRNAFNAADIAKEIERLRKDLERANNTRTTTKNFTISQPFNLFGVSNFNVSKKRERAPSLPAVKIDRNRVDVFEIESIKKEIENLQKDLDRGNNIRVSETRNEQYFEDFINSTNPYANENVDKNSDEYRFLVGPSIKSTQKSTNIKKRNNNNYETRSKIEELQKKLERLINSSSIKTQKTTTSIISNPVKRRVQNRPQNPVPSFGVITIPKSISISPDSF